VAAVAMRGILVDHARAQRAAKRGGGALQVSLSEVEIRQDEDAIDLLDLHDALTSLAELDPRQSRIVELRYFAGLSIEETAEILEISPATVKREWAMARTWLHKRLFKGAG
jgi:RNA polymerase sigma factor (TIGR02999 family)